MTYHVAHVGLTQRIVNNVGIGVIYIIFSGLVLLAPSSLITPAVANTANTANAHGPTSHNVKPSQLPLRRLEAGIIAVRQGNNSAAIKLLTPPANHGDAKAQYMLALLFTGSDRPNSAQYPGQDRAFQLFAKAAKQGYVGAVFQLGFAYERGNGTEPDIKKALFFYRLAAYGHNVNAQLNLAILYAGGTKIKRNLAWAYAWAVIAKREAATKPVHPALTARIDEVIKLLSSKVSFQQRRKADNVATKLLGFPA